MTITFKTTFGDCKEGEFITYGRIRKPRKIVNTIKGLAVKTPTGYNWLSPDYPVFRHTLRDFEKEMFSQ